MTPTRALRAPLTLALMLGSVLAWSDGRAEGAASLHPGNAHAPKSSVSRNVVSRSVGAPNAGRLEGGLRIEESARIHPLGMYASTDVRWGTRELVEMIERSAHEVGRRYPDAVLGVGQLSQHGGGDIDRHHSHESGRDADLAFYLVDANGRAVPRDHLLAIRPDGTAASEPTLHFDEGRNWALLTALITDPHARVTHIFIETHLRTRLLAYGARVGAPADLRVRLAEVMMQPRHALPHDDHFHVRIACPSTSPRCIEWPVANRGSVHLASAQKGHAPHLPKPPTHKLQRARASGRVVIAQPTVAPQPSTSPITTDTPPNVETESVMLPATETLGSD